MRQARQRPWDAGLKHHTLSWLAAACIFALPAIGCADAADPAATAPVERLRQIPDHAQKGVMWPIQNGYVRINDSTMRLAPGLRIRDMNNRIVPLGSVRQPKKIRYTLDMYGQVHRIWISPTGAYMGRHLPPEPPGGRRDEVSDVFADESTDQSTDSSTFENTDDAGEASEDSPGS